MAVKIRLKRMGKIRAPFYRVVVMDSRAKRDGRAIEEIGKYHPTEEPSLIDIDTDRAQYWLGVGAQPTEQVQALRDLAADNSYLLVSPMEGLPSPVVASAWGLQLQLDSADDERLPVFLVKYLQGEQTPELGASCSGGYTA